jgi:hypothetical protein
LFFLNNWRTEAHITSKFTPVYIKKKQETNHSTSTLVHCVLKTLERQDNTYSTNSQILHLYPPYSEYTVAAALKFPFKDFKWLEGCMRKNFTNHDTLKGSSHQISVQSRVFRSSGSIFISREVSSAEREIEERETNGSIVHNISTIGNRT